MIIHFLLLCNGSLVALNTTENNTSSPRFSYYKGNQSIELNKISPHKINMINQMIDLFIIYHRCVFKNDILNHCQYNIYQNSNSPLTIHAFLPADKPQNIQFSISFILNDYSFDKNDQNIFFTIDHPLFSATTFFRIHSHFSNAYHEMVITELEQNHSLPYFYQFKKGIMIHNSISNQPNKKETFITKSFQLNEEGTPLWMTQEEGERVYNSQNFLIQESKKISQFKTTGTPANSIFNPIFNSQGQLIDYWIMSVNQPTDDIQNVRHVSIHIDLNQRITSEKTQQIQSYQGGMKPLQEKMTTYHFQHNAQQIIHSLEIQSTWNQAFQKHQINKFYVWNTFSKENENFINKKIILSTSLKNAENQIQFYKIIKYDYQKNPTTPILNLITIDDIYEINSRLDSCRQTTIKFESMAPLTTSKIKLKILDIETSSIIMEEEFFGDIQYLVHGIIYNQLFAFKPKANHRLYLKQASTEGDIQILHHQKESKLIR